MTIGLLYNRFRSYLEKHGIPDPDIDARYIISYHLGLKTHELFLKKDAEVPFFKRAVIEYSMRQRGFSRPSAYITGFKYFYRDKFKVGPGTLIPRADTEHIVYAAEELKPGYNNIIDIGTGSGALAVSLARIYPLSRITALDIDTGAAKWNIKRLGIKNISLCKTDFLKNLDGVKDKRTFYYDLIVSNPPYLSAADMKKHSGALRYEPARAFYGGEDGLSFYSAISLFAASGLSRGGYIIVETDYKWPEVVKIFSLGGFSIVEVRKDYGGLERVVVARKDF